MSQEWTKEQLTNYNIFEQKLKRCLFEPNSEKELLLAKLKNFYRCEDKEMRFRIIADCRDYLRELEQEDVKAVDVMDLRSEETEEEFLRIEQELRENIMNDQSINFMIYGFIKTLEKVYSLNLRRRIYQFLHGLTRQLHRMTAMNYTDGRGGGIVIYAGPHLGIHDLPCAFFYFGAKVD